jgi:hypothetical protein
MREAFPDDSAPRYLLRDRDGIYGEDFREQVAAMGIREVLIGSRRRTRYRLRPRGPLSGGSAEADHTGRRTRGQDSRTISRENRAALGMNYWAQ